MIAALLLLVCAGIALALVGPAWPPPGGVDFTMSGAGAGSPGGQNFHFSNFDPNAFSALYWGPGASDAIALTLDGGPPDDVLTFSASSGAAAEWTGTCFYSGGGTDIPVRFTLTITGLGADPFVDAGSIGAPPGIGVLADNSSGLDFSANFIFEGLHQGTWTPVNDLPQPGGGYTATSFSGGFFYEAPVSVSPSTWGHVKSLYSVPYGTSP